MITYRIQGRYSWIIIALVYKVKYINNEKDWNK